jgi:hypothetical protein
MLEHRNGPEYLRVVYAAVCMTLLAACGAGEDTSAAAPGVSAVAVPPAPTNLRATAGTVQVGLVWSASSGATSYDVRRSSNSGGPFMPIATTIPTSYIDTAVSGGVAYYYVVAAANASGASAASAPAAVTPTPVAVTPLPGNPGCGLTQAAFCDTFEAIAQTRGRAGDLDVQRWSGSRSNGQQPSGNGAALAAGPATIRYCRPDLSAPVFPPHDFSICNASTAIRSAHLAVGTGSQNYGQNAFRIRQPFDFRGRTGRIVFDAEAFYTADEHGWAAIAITEDPTPVPSFIRASQNDEGGAIPRNAVEIHLSRECGTTGRVGIRFIGVFRGHELEAHDAPGNSPCVSGIEGHLNRFVIEISRTHVAVRGTQPSDDGVSFGPLELLYEADVDLPFEVGYVQLSTHNHATRKYTPGFGSDIYRDAWVTRWDNVGFDGPVRTGTKEYEVADSLVPGNDAWNQPGPVMNVGYRVADERIGPAVVHQLRNVDPTGTTRARLALVAWYDAFSGDPLENFTLRYRFNGGTWRDRKFTAAEMNLVRTNHSQGLFTQMLDVPLQDLVAGTNTLEFTTRGVPQGYPPLVSSIDLVLDSP